MKKIILTTVVAFVLFQTSFGQQPATKPYLPSVSELAFSNSFVQNSFDLPSKSQVVVKDIKQGFGHLKKNKTMAGQPIEINGKTFEHGMGVHANSEVQVLLHGKAKRFTAEVGYTKTWQTPTSKIIFSIEANGKTLWKSSPLFYNDAPLRVDVSLDGIKKFTIKVNSADNNTNWCNACWANAQVEMENGENLWLDDFIAYSVSSGIPYSFVLGNLSSRDFLSTWNFINKDSVSNDRIVYNIKWIKPDGSFEVNCKVTEFLKHPAVEWKLSFKNTGKQNSAILENVNSLDMILRASNSLDLATLHCSKGSRNSPNDFMPIDAQLYTNQTYHMESRDGRNSESFLPFWNLAYKNYGLVTAIGWSGDWNADFTNISNCPYTTMKAGMTNLKTYLKPGEEISVPSVCLLYWEGNDALRGNNLFRRYMNDVVVPKWNGENPIVLANMGGAASYEGVNETNQMKLIKDIAGTGANTYWLDAGWYGNGSDGTWWNGRGNWYPEKTKFPNGMKPISDEAHKNGLKFLLWFDPECVSPGTEIAVKHPEYVIRRDDKATGLFNLGNPDALKYLTDMITKNIIDWNIDVFRNDYNTDPAQFWKMADEQGRTGITEIRYVEGLYKFWSALRSRKPDLLIDNCASGGRRIDYETCKLSVPLWRSDYECNFHTDIYEASQNQSYGLNLYLPYNSTGFGISYDPYKDRSIANASVVFALYGNDKNGQSLFAATGMNDDPHLPVIVDKEKVKKVFDDMKSYNSLMSADYYPLTDFSLKDNVWMAMQYDSPENGEGCVVCFRRPNATFNEAEFKLNGIDANSNYKLIYLNTGKESLVKGDQLLKLTIRLNKEESEVVKYIKE